MRAGSTPPAMSQATRWTSVAVLPVPAPATISSGPLPCVAASRCRGLSPANRSSTGGNSVIRGADGKKSGCLGKMARQNRQFAHYRPSPVDVQRDLGLILIQTRFYPYYSSNFAPPEASHNGSKSLTFHRSATITDDMFYCGSSPACEGDQSESHRCAGTVGSSFGPEEFWFNLQPS